MKALVTAGGRGTRLRPITHTRNKHLIPIANKPILQYALEYLADAGIRQVGIVVNPDYLEVEQAFGSGADFNLEITYIPQESPLGLAHCVKISQEFLEGEPFVFYLGDNMVVGGIKRFLDEFHARKSNCHLTLALVKDPERFGVPEIQGDRIVAIEEKPRRPKSSFAVAGIYFYDGAIFEAVNAIRPSARGELEISDAHQYLIDKGYQVSFSEITGWWKDTGLPEDLLEANRLVLDHAEAARHETAEVDAASRVVGRVILQEGARIVNSHLRGPAIVGKHTLIQNAYVGPYTSIHDNCTVTGSEIEFSIVLSNSKIADVGIRIEGSLIGYDALIVRGNESPRTHRFVIGDQSMVEVV